MRSIRNIIGTEIGITLKAAYLASKGYGEPVSFDFSGATVIVDAAQGTFASDTEWANKKVQDHLQYIPTYEDETLNRLNAEIEELSSRLQALRSQAAKRILSILNERAT